MISLGPFELTGVIGEGGMGQVWHGRHLKQDVDVAIKVIHPERVTGRRALLLFRREARAMATFHHRGIIGVYDYGLIDDEVQRASGQRLHAGSPYLVMDFAEAGSLRDRPQPGIWAELKATLLQILDALAHAHAHDLIHRDLKPGNVLVSEEDGHLQLMLADFGLAYVAGRPPSTAEHEPDVGVVGTPHYMAPEQIRDQSRRIGPWTDLYALGCMAFELASGAPPFQATTAMGAMLAHIDKTPPPLTSTMAVPAGFEHWVCQLLAKSPGQRFECAADAAWALARLDEGWAGDDGEDSGSVDLLVQHPTLAGSLSHLYWDPVALLEQGRVDVEATTIDSAPPVVVRADEPEDRPLDDAERPPLPADWRSGDQPPWVPLAGVGLGLVEMRRMGLVGREEERDAIWRALHQVLTDRSPRIVVLRGPSGFGKSAIADAMARRAVELGAATLMKATFGEGSAPGQGLAAMVTRYLRAGQVDESHRRSHLQETLAALQHRDAPPLDIEEFESIVASAHKEEGTPAKILPPTLALIGAVARRRPVVLWLDDAQWGSDELNLAQALLEAGDLPVLCLITVRDEALVGRTVEHDQLRRLSHQDAVRQLHLEPLAESEQRRLIRQLLPLDPGLTESIARRTGGNPHFAVELIGDWIAQGSLVFDEGRFRVSTQGEGQLPDSLHEVWARRLERIVGRFDGDQNDVRRAIELGACLGRFIKRSDWLLACKIAGLSAGESLIGVFIRERLIRGDGQLGEFTHEMLRESILRIAAEEGRLQQHHQICLQVARQSHDDDDLWGMERQCRHLLGAGRHEEAIEPLLSLAEVYVESMVRQPVIQAATLADRALDHLNAANDDPRRLRTWVTLLKGYQFIDLERAAHLGGLIEQHAQLPRDLPCLADATVIMASIAHASSQIDEALTLNSRALDYFQMLDDQRGGASVHMMLGYLLRIAGRTDEGRQHLQAALEVFRDIEDDGRCCDALRLLAQIATSRGDFARARQLLEQAIPYGERSGIGQLMPVKGALADLLLHQGDLDAAHQAYLEQYEFYLDLGSWHANVYAVNLALIHALQGSLEEASTLARQAIAEMKRQDYTLYLGAPYLILLCVAAGAGNRPQWDEYLALATDKLDEAPVIEREIATIAQRAGELAQQNGWRDEADKAFALANTIWQALGDPDHC